MKKLIIIFFLIPSIAFGGNVSEMKKRVARIGDKNRHGSGVVISSSGLIITNNHVILDDKLVEVTIDNQSYTGRVVYKDLMLDMAFVKVPAIDMPYAKINTSIEDGQDAYVIGFPLDIGCIATKGIVSAILNMGYYTNIITDASTNSGNSGGGLFDEKGNLIGLITDKVKQDVHGVSHFTGLGVAMSASDFINFTNQLIKEYENE